MVNVGSGELLVIGFVLLFAVIPIALLALAIVDLARRPDWQWTATDQSQMVWAMLILLVGCVGPALYLVMARPKLQAAAQSGPPTDIDPGA